jgi:predicted dehydrogenase
MIRLGLVGVGSWGQRYIATVARRDDCRIVSFARSTAAGDVAIPGATQVASWRALVDRARGDELDAIVVATTPENQAEVAAEAVAAGVPAIVEKPLGLSRAAAERVLTSVRASDGAPPVVVNYAQLYTPGHRALRSLVSEAGAPVVSIASEGSNRGPFRRFSSLYDYGPHDLSLCLDLLGAGSAFRLEKVATRPGVDGGELFDAEFVLGPARVVMRVGNGATAKARRFSVTLSGGRTLTHDGLAEPGSMLVDDAKPVRVDATLPLDVMLSEFLGRCERWKRGERDHAFEVRSAEFSVRMNEILDTIARAASGC